MVLLRLTAFRELVRAPA